MEMSLRDGTATTILSAPGDIDNESERTEADDGYLGPRGYTTVPYAPRQCQSADQDAVEAVGVARNAGVGCGAGSD